MYNTTEAEVMQMGMEYLVEKLGIIDTERFISKLLRERFDYTEWRTKYFADVDLDTFLNEAADFDRKNPFRGGKKND